MWEAGVRGDGAVVRHVGCASVGQAPSTSSPVSPVKPSVQLPVQAGTPTAQPK